MRKSIIIVLCISVSALLGQAAFGESREYRKTVGDVEYTVMCEITRRAGGYSIHIEESRSGRVVITEELDVDNGFSTESWSIVDRSKDLEVTAVRDGKVLHLTYTEDNRRRKKTSRIDGDPWYQLFALSFEKFAASGREETTFWSVNPDEVRPYEFSLTRQDEQRMSAAGSSVRCAHFRIALTGFLAAFWHADSWHGTDDGLFVRYEGVNGRPGAPMTTVQLADVQR